MGVVGWLEDLIAMPLGPKLHTRDGKVTALSLPLLTRGPILPTGQDSDRSSPSHLLWSGTGRGEGGVKGMNPSHPHPTHPQHLMVLDNTPFEFTPAHKHEEEELLEEHDRHLPLEGQYLHRSHLFYPCECE